uniref:Uncharacterized protein n=1 Tax=Tanacetum cinerariifolium TaxID=118510 RepID=A0A699JQQ9_TANCI|nr:hypothetical protein [Tanacetum cinerariifolium]
MSTQQDIYAASSENRPPMLNKDNYVPWLSRIIQYERSRPNGKMIVNSIENRPYVSRMIATLGEPDLHVLVPESFHEQTDEELTETDIKRMDADDQAIQTILLGLPKDNGGIQGAQNEGVQSGGNQNGLVVVPGIANQSGTGNIVAANAEAAHCSKEEAGIQLRAKEFDFMVAVGDLDMIEEVNTNYILMANLQQASTSGTQHDKSPVYDTDGSAEVHLNDNYYDNEIFNMFTQEEQYTNLLEPIPEPQLVPQMTTMSLLLPQVWCKIGVQ